MATYLKAGAVLGAVALGAAGILMPGGDAPGLLAYSDPQVIAEGRALYAGHCAACHGADLEGEPDWREPKPSGRMPAPPHDETGHTWHHPDEQLLALTKHGVAAVVGGGYESDMPGFGGVLSDAEILAVLAFIKSTWSAEIIEAHNEMNAAHAAAQ